MFNLVMLNLGMWEIIVIALVILLLFGGAKIPELMRGLGKGVKEFKDATNGLTDDKKKDDTAAPKEEKADTTSEENK